MINHGPSISKDQTLEKLILEKLWLLGAKESNPWAIRTTTHGVDGHTLAN
jgi:hypothetical protein